MVLRLFLTFALATFAFAPHAEQRVLLDPLVQDWFQNTARPLLEKAGINPATTRQFVLINSEINAFVTPNRDIFFHTGLILKAKNENEVQGVLAHEIGHIMAGHYVRFEGAANRLSIPLLLAGAAGVGAALAGAPGAGQAVLIGSQALGTGALLKFSRTHEQEADQAAVKLLTSTGESAEGLLTFFETLRTQELNTLRSLPPFLATHPLTSERIESLRSLSASPTLPRGADASRAPNNPMIFKEVQARIAAFTQPPAQTLRQYKGTTPDNLTARAIAEAILGKHAEALKTLEPLLKVNPSPFTRDLAGRIEQDRGNFSSAISYFEAALARQPNLTLTRLALSESYVADNQAEKALPNLQRITTEWPEWPQAWRVYGLALGQSGRIGESHLALAEQAILLENKKDAILHIGIAEKNLPATAKAALSRLEILKMQLPDLK